MFQNGPARDQAFELIVKRYQQRLYWHIRKILISHEDSDDVLQNTFIRVYQALDKFREKSALYTWLYRIATNEALTLIKNRKKKQTVSWNDVEEGPGNALEGDVYFGGDEIQEKLQKAILTLPQKQRLVFNMKYFDEMKYQDISEILGTSVGSLKASYHHAVKKIENYLKNH